MVHWDVNDRQGFSNKVIDACIITDDTYQCMMNEARFSNGTSSGRTGQKALILAFFSEY